MKLAARKLARKLRREAAPPKIKPPPAPVSIEAQREKSRQRYAANKEKERERQRLYRLRNLEARRQAERDRQNSPKVRARQALREAISSGRIRRPGRCEKCGVECEPHGHHTDYARPLFVEWLCVSCHGEAHRKTDSQESNATG